MHSGQLYCKLSCCIDLTIHQRELHNFILYIDELKSDELVLMSDMTESEPTS